MGRRHLLVIRNNASKPCADGIDVTIHCAAAYCKAEIADESHWHKQKSLKLKSQRNLKERYDGIELESRSQIGGRKWPVPPIQDCNPETPSHTAIAVLREREGTGAVLRVRVL